MKHWFPVLLVLLFISLSVPAENPEAPGVPESNADRSTLKTLASFVELKEGLSKDKQALARQIEKASSNAEKNDLKKQLEKIESDLNKTNRNFEDIAAGVDISSLRAVEQEQFDFQKEVFALLRPALDEMKQMTAHVRQKSDLREKIAYYDERLPVIGLALEHVRGLLKESKDQALARSLKATIEGWEKQQALMQGEQQAAKLQLAKLLSAETSLTEASQSYLKSFFNKRGLYLAEALLIVAVVILLSRLSLAAMRRYIPGFRRRHRSFRIRLLELVQRLMTMLLVVLGPMVVFYLVEDWVLFSVGILLLLGIAWTLRQALPRYWHQVQLFLNVGAVREGERINMDGIPWLVSQINVFSTLINPTAGLSQRVPIDDLVDLKSRPVGADEPWFPCRPGDWVLLSDGCRGKVMGISPELVQLVERGGAHKTYLTGDFLSASPRNLSVDFRLKEVIGISYSLQKEATNSIPDTLQAYIRKRIGQEGYGDKLLNLRVEFAQANNSSLDLVVIADFDGSLGDLYNRLRRAIQRWCVDACSEYGWEIPFPQMTLHGALSPE